MSMLSDNIKFLREKKGLSQEDFGKLIGATRGQVGSYEEDRAKPKTEIANKICKHFSIQVEDLFAKRLNKSNVLIVQEPEGMYLTKHQDGIPLFPDYASAGTPNGFADALKDLPRYYVPGFQDCDLMVPVSGDSMYSDYSSGDIVICKQIHDPSFIQWGHAYLVDTVQGLILKNLMPSDKDGFIKFVSNNNKYPPFEVKKKEAKRFFIVKGKIKKNLI